MFTHLTKTSWTTKAVLVLVAVAFLIPTFFVSAQDGNVSFPTEDLSGLSGSELLPPPSGDFSTFPPPPDAEPAPPPNPNFPPVFYPPGFNSTNPQAQDGGQEFTTDSGTPATTGGVGSRTSVPNQQIPDGVYGDSAFKGMLYSIVVNLFGSLITWAGWLLNWAINDFVIGFGGFFNTTGVGVAVNELWSLVRDFFNILFIFGFIWIGFQMILDSGNSRAKQTLVSLIMAALLVNFSLFISKFVVDFSNRLASEVAIAAFPADDSVFDSTENIGGNIRTQRVNVADTFFAHMGIAETLNADQAVINNTNAPWSYIFGSAIFYLIAAFVFAAGGVMLMIRFVALSIFMVLSPFMFLGWVFPGMQGWTSKYWKGFLGRAFYAPVYIVLLFFAGTILQNFFGTRGSMTNDFAFGIQSAGGQQTFNPLISILGAFALSCAFLIAAVQVAGKMSADGAGGVMKVGSGIVRGGQRRLKNGAIGVGRGAVGGAAGVGRFAARNTLGAATTYGVNRAGQAGREALRRRNAELAQGSSFDRLRARTSERIAGGALDRVATATVAGSETRADRLARVAKENAALNTAADAGQRYTNTRDDLATISRLTASVTAASTTMGPLTAAQMAEKKELEDAQTRVGQSTRQMTNEEVRDNFTTEQRNEAYVAANLSDDHLKFLKESGVLTNAESKTLRGNRDDAKLDAVSESFEDTTSSAEQLNNAFDRMEQTVRRMSADSKAKLGFDRLTQERVAVHLTDDDIVKLEESGRYTADQVEDIRGARNLAQNNIAIGGTNYGTAAAPATVGAGSTQFHDRRRRELMSNAQKAGRLSPGIFINPGMAGSITPAALVQRENNGLDAGEIAAIQSNVERLKGTSDYNRWVQWSSTPAGRASRFTFT